MQSKRKNLWYSEIKKRAVILVFLKLTTLIFNNNIYRMALLTYTGYYRAFQIHQNVNFLFYALGFRKQDYIRKNEIRRSRIYAIFKNGTLGICTYIYRACSVIVLAGSRARFVRGIPQLTVYDLVSPRPMTKTSDVKCQLVRRYFYGTAASESKFAKDIKSIVN